MGDGRPGAFNRGLSQLDPGPGLIYLHLCLANFLVGRSGQKQIELGLGHRLLGLGDGHSPGRGLALPSCSSGV